MDTSYRVWYNSPKGAGGADATVSTAGAYVGDGMPPVPAKLAAKIWRWEFVEMGELLPEFWAGPKEEAEQGTSG